MLLIFFIIFSGFIALNIAMKRHYKQLIAKQTTHFKRYQMLSKVFAYTALIISCYLSVLHSGMANGLLYWLAFLTMAAFLNSFLLTYRPQWLMFSAGCGLLLGVVLSMTN